MTTKKLEPKVIVFLTPEALQQFAGEPLMDFAEGGRWFPCVSYEQNGSFLDLKVIYKQHGEPVVVELSVLLSLIGYAVSAEAAKAIGFK